MPGRRPRGMLALALAVGACVPADGSRAAGGAREPDSSSVRTFVDTDGRALHLAVPVGRIVSLVPSATLTLHAIGAGDLLVGRTDYDTATWASDLPSVGGGLEPGIETIVSLRPDVVVRFGGPQDTRTPSRLDDLGIPHIAIRLDDIDDIFSTIRLLGDVTGRAGPADSLVADLKARLERVRQGASGVPVVRAAYMLGGDPPWVAGPGTYVDELISLAGGVNVFSDLGSLYAAVSPEELLSRDLDVVLAPAAAAIDPKLIGGARVVRMGEELELPGPGVAEAAREVARALHGGGP